MRRLPLLYTTAFLVCNSSSLQATIIHVPTDSTTIQSGINGAVNGDTVMVHPGTYVENIDFIGKAIAVISEQGPDSTVIDGNQAGSVVTFRNGEGIDSVIEGFTIRNGSGTYFDPYWEYGGGGIYCDGSAPTIRYNRITDNAAHNGGGIAVVLASPAVIKHNHIFENSANTRPDRKGGGGGIAIGWGSDPEVSHNEIYSNYSNMAGGGIACGFDCDPEVRYNTIRHNVANVYAGGIQIYSYTTGTFENNLIMGNSSLGANGAGGISCRLGAAPVIANSVIIGNSAVTYGGGVRCFEDAAPTLKNNVVFGNEAGVSGGGIESDTGASATIANTILWNNDAPAGTEIWIGPHQGSPAAITISYSDVQGGIASVHVDPGSTLNWGAGMIDDDPLLRDPGARDFHLMATACGDPSDSPCVDAGDPAVTDSVLDCSHGLGATRSDIGAYGGRGVGPTVSVESEGGGQQPEIVALPRSLRLTQNCPNPFNPRTTIAFVVPGGVGERPFVSVAVYDIHGRFLKTLLSSEIEPGAHAVTWDGRDAVGRTVASGVYAYRLQLGVQTLSKKMTLLR